MNIHWQFQKYKFYKVFSSRVARNWLFLANFLKKKRKKKKKKDFSILLKIVRPDQSRPVTWETELLRSEVRMDFQIPDEIPIFKKNNARKSRTLWLPKAELYHLHNVEVLFHSYVITQDGNFFLWDKSGDPIYRDVAGSWQYFSGNRAFPDYCLMRSDRHLEVETVETAALISGRCSENYFHWLIEYLPRVLMLERYKDIPLLAAGHIPKQCKDALASIFGERRIIWTDKEKKYFVKDITIPSMLNFAPDDLSLPLWTKSGLASDYLTEFKNRTLNRLPLKPTLTKKKIFFARQNSSRNILNIHEIIKIAKEYDFEIIDPSIYSFHEQVNMVQSAQYIAGPAGAAFANILFCRPNTKILALLAQHNQETALFSNLAKISNCQFFNVFGESQWPKRLYPSLLNYIHGKYFISPKKWRKSLEYVTSDA